jgi:CheY-like chemotaxis protein
LALPDMTGLEVARRIRVETRNALVPIVVVSLSSGGGIASVVPISAVLRKPITSGELLAALEHADVRPADGTEVLVVEDDPASLRLMQVMLADLGFACVGCGRGEEGLSAARRSTPGAVILDLMLPGMDGFGFLEEFRKLPRCRHVPVIVWTVRDLTIPERDRLALQTQAFLAKAPGAGAVLVEDLRRCLQAVGKRVKPADGPREESSLG